VGRATGNERMNRSAPRTRGVTNVADETVRSSLVCADARAGKLYFILTCLWPEFYVLSYHIVRHHNIYSVSVREENHCDISMNPRQTVTAHLKCLFLSTSAVGDKNDDRLQSMLKALENKIHRFKLSFEDCFSETMFMQMDAKKQKLAS